MSSIIFKFVWSMVFLTVGCAIGLLIWYRLRSSEKKLRTGLLSLTVAILIGSLTPRVLNSIGFRDEVANVIGVEVAIAASATETFLAHPEVKKNLKSMSQAEFQGWVNKLGQHGMKRLSLEKLRKWNDERLYMASLSETFCAAYWTRADMSVEFANILPKLSKEKIDALTTLNLEAAFAELQSQGKDSIVKVDNFPQLLKELADKLTEKKDKNKFLKIVSTTDTSKISLVDGCWMAKAVMEGSRKLSEADQIRLLRSFASDNEQ